MAEPCAGVQHRAAFGRETSFWLRECSLLRQRDRDLVKAHRIFKDELIERIFP
jgi:hypothetical protein